MTHRSRRTALLIAAAFAGVLSCEFAVGGDEDERPPYMIYIDPVTGKYTAEPPPHEVKERAIGSSRASAKQRPSSLPIVAIGILVVIALFFGAKESRKDMRQR